MPLRATLNNKELFSFKVPMSQWETLKKSSSRKSIKLPCCDTRAIVKTSSLGTQFFAHHQKPKDCISKPESIEHLRLKALVAAAAELVGWEVTTEFIGVSSNGEKWIADVYCTKGRVKVALEIQLSQQTESELDFRHERYCESGVRDAWLMKDNVYKNSGYSDINHIPRFCIKNFEDDKTPLMSDFELTVEQFVKHLLLGDLKWKEDVGEEIIYFMDSICWKCLNEIKIPVGLGDSDNINYDTFIKTVPNCSTFYESLIKILGGSVLQNLGLTTVGSSPNLKGNAPNFPFCVKCNNCFAPQSNYHTLKGYQEVIKGGLEHRYIIYNRYKNNGRYELK